jgi:hypothetical protein
MLAACFLLATFFGPEDGGNTFLRNVGKPAACFLLAAACFAHCFILKMEAVRSCETFVNFYQTTLRYISE